MNRILNRVAFNASAHFRSCRLNSSTSRTEEPLWKDPFKHALPPKQETLTEFEEAPVDWKYVERLLPPELIPEMPKVDQPTPSGWRPPKDPTPDLPYYIKRSRHHMPQLHLERRRDKVNPKTMMYEYIELVTLKGVYGDLFDGCSNCGYGFCKKCLTKKHLLPRLSNKPVPVCDSCYTTLTKGVVQPLEKSRNESSTKNDGKWWDDDKPPPSMRQQYSIKPKLMVSDKDSAEIPSTSTEILANLRPSENVESLINNKFASNEDDKLARELKLPIVPPAEDSIEGLEERLAALRNVPVDMVVNESESESELDDDAKELLERAEQRLRKKEPDLFACYQNEGLNSSSDEETKQKPNKKES
ncbi:hypothetical protein M3Y96_00698800 [Aphelenchoides besseyi]|nr:hypothetical protein M3Y96_00698800 [Aphelenchoides besseyi]